MNFDKKIYGGLTLTLEDERDFHLGSIGFQPTIVPLTDFGMIPLEIKDQGSSDMCTSYALTAVSEFQEKILLSPEYTFAKTKQIQGEWQSYGAGLREACKSATDYGFFPKPSPYTREKDGRDFVADWTHWNITYDNFAKIHKKQSYFLVDGITDNIFDSIRTVLWNYKNTAVLTGVMWRHEWTYVKDGIIPIQYGNGDFGHAFCWIGQKIINGVPYLVAQLSNGTEIGNKGIFFFPKEVVNKECIFKNFAFIDLPDQMTKEEVAEKSIVIKKNVVGKVWYYLGNYFKEFIQ